MIKKLLFESNALKWYVFARDPEKPGQVIDTNEYLILGPDNTILLDPGGTEIFPAVVSAVSEVIDVTKVKTFMCSHQDPDIMSSLPLWMGLCPQAHIYLPWLWTSFVAHFGHEYTSQFIAVEDAGCDIPLGGGLEPLHLIPAHYCHSSGNFSLYDPNSGILFSGDLGAALMPSSAENLIVQDFQAHVHYMEGFHKRWMPSAKAKDAWVERVRKLRPRMICPQHGAIFQGENVDHFLDWLQQLEVGITT